jgi:hypothetical protein
LSIMGMKLISIWWNSPFSVLIMIMPSMCAMELLWDVALW